jgi:hypothetical protein
MEGFAGQLLTKAIFVWLVVAVIIGANKLLEAMHMETHDACRKLSFSSVKWIDDQLSCIHR